MVKAAQGDALRGEDAGGDGNLLIADGYLVNVKKRGGADEDAKSKNKPFGEGYLRGY